MEEKNQLAPVANGTRKEPTLDRKLRNVFISDQAGSVGDFIVWDVIVPGIKGMLQQAGHGLVDGIFGTGGRSRSSTYSYRRDYDEPSYWDLAHADDIVPDDVIFKNYEGVEFVNDDFF